MANQISGLWISLPPEENGQGATTLEGGKKGKEKEKEERKRKEEGRGREGGLKTCS